MPKGYQRFCSRSHASEQKNSTSRNPFQFQQSSEALMPVALNWGFSLSGAVDDLPPKTPMEIMPMKSMPFKEFVRLVRESLISRQIRLQEWHKYYVVHPVPENGSVLVGWWRIPLKHQATCRAQILSQRKNAGQRRRTEADGGTNQEEWKDLETKTEESQFSC